MTLCLLPYRTAVKLFFFKFLSAILNIHRKWPKYVFEGKQYKIYFIIRNFYKYCNPSYHYTVFLLKTTLNRNNKNKYILKYRIKLTNDAFIEKKLKITDKKSNIDKFCVFSSTIQHNLMASLHLSSSCSK